MQEVSLRAPFWLGCLAVLLMAGACSAVAPRLSCGNRDLRVSYDVFEGAMSVQDARANVTWYQRALPFRMEPVTARANPDGFDVTYRDGAGARLMHAKMVLEHDSAEMLFTISVAGEMRSPLVYPSAFVPPSDDTYLVLPINEGVAWYVNDPTIRYSQYALNDAHGLCMPFFGMTDGRSGMMAIFETPDDARIQITKEEGVANIMPLWLAQHGKWGYNRQIRYVFLNDGGHVAIAKRFRRYAAEHGALKTLEQKRGERPNVDMLVGAANVWYWDQSDALDVAREMKSAGIDRILWSRSNTPEAIEELNKLGVLTGRYEIYAGAVDPREIPHVKFPKPDWPEEAWPAGLMRDANDRLVQGWPVKLDDGRSGHAQQVCDLVIPPLAAKKIAEELKTHPYKARFLDTTAAYRLQECYDPRHPMTRSQNRVARERLLALLGDRFSLVAGSEDGEWWNVPFCDYFEGTLSIYPFRATDEPADLLQPEDPLPSNTRDFQLNERIRIPLWELVFHDCAVCYWHWDEYNNRAPAGWHKRDLFDALYGQPPMFMFRRPFWHENKSQFIGSYQTTAPLARAVGYSEMTDHRFLSRDRSIQQTSFANGMRVTVNFSSYQYRMPDGYILSSGEVRVEGWRNRPG